MNIFKQITANNILLEPYDFIKELAMEAYIIENESILKLDDVNFADPTVIDVEIALKKGRANKDGRIDILAQYPDDVYAIVELKLDEINSETLKQLEDYLKQRDQLKDFICDPEKLISKENGIKWIGIMVGKSISRELSDKLVNGYEYDCGGVKIPIAAITINRYRAKSSSDIYVVSDTYFRFSTTNKDYSKYLFNGVEYNKGQLVNAVIKSYVQQNPATSFAALEKAFPKELQGSAGVFDTIDYARELYSKHNGRYKRHQINPDKLIILSDATIATSTQWGRGNAERFIKKAKELGLQVAMRV